MRKVCRSCGGEFSELAIKRSEYGAVIANEGFEALIGKIDAKLADWAAGG